MTNTRPRVVFCSATRSIADVIHDGLGETDAEAIRRLTPEYGTALSAMPAAEAQVLYEAQFITAVREITAEDYDDALNVLPPVDWTRHSGGESFKISERIAGRITAIYVALNGHHYRFDDDIRTSHVDCLKRVADFRALQCREAAR
jgi:hypothetical protein